MIQVQNVTQSACTAAMLFEIVGHGDATNPLRVVRLHQANLHMLIQETPMATQIPRQRKEKTKERRPRPMSLLKRKQSKCFHRIVFKNTQNAKRSSGSN